MDYFFHNSTKKLITAVLDTFNDIQVPIYSAEGKIVSTKEVPLRLGFGTREHIFNSTDLEQLNKGNYSILPRGALTIDNYTQNLVENTNRLNRVVEVVNSDGGYTYMRNSVKASIDLTLEFNTKTMNDCMVIIEQILPQFSPSINIRYQELDFIEGEDNNASTNINLVNTELETNDITLDNTPLYKAIFKLQVSLNIYPPIKDVDLIENVKLTLADKDNFDIKDWDKKEFN